MTVNTGDSIRIKVILSRFMLVILAGAGSLVAMAQDAPIRVVDFVDLPPQLALHETDPDLLGGWYITFREEWHISPEDRTLRKVVVSYTPGNQNAPLISADSLESRFSTLVERLREGNRDIRLREVAYEFMLLDPHVVESGNVAFAGPDSMDTRTKNLQGALISLVRSVSDPGTRYDLDRQMLSLTFHEEWTIDPVAPGITKKVVAVTPVIWQLRRTDDGEPVNDAETGLPVYYKNSLQRIGLRNP